MTGLIPPEEMTDDAAPPVAEAPDDLAAVRDLIVRTHPDVVPELIGGGTIADLIASIEPARQAHARVAARVAPSSSPRVPAGGAGPVPFDPVTLSPAAKIRRALNSTR